VTSFIRAVDRARPNARHADDGRSGTRPGGRWHQACVELRRTARTAVWEDALTNATTLPTGEHTASGSQFRYGMRNAAMTYTSSVSTDVAAYEDLPGHHLLAVRNLIATTNDQWYHGSASELPLGTPSGTSPVYWTP
jgi:hypothetical protein